MGVPRIVLSELLTSFDDAAGLGLDAEADEWMLEAGASRRRGKKRLQRLQQNVGEGVEKEGITPFTSATSHTAVSGSLHRH